MVSILSLLFQTAYLLDLDLDANAIAFAAWRKGPGRKR
jgi:hypothetical protein